MKKIIIIENDRDTREILSYVFDKSEYQVFQYPNRIRIGEVILKNPDIILLDYFLDDSLGSQMCAELKRNPMTKYIPVILMSTSLNLPEITEQCAADAYIEKPFDINALEYLVRKLLNPCISIGL